MTTESLLLLSGTLADERLWAQQLAGLSLYADVSLPDLTQHGTVGAVAAAVLESAPPQFALAGFSMGGVVAQEMLYQAPHRVTRLALLDTSTGVPSAEKLERFRSWRSADEATFEDLLKVFPSWIHPANEGVAPLVKTMGRDLGLEVFRRQAGILLTQQNEPERLRGVRGPALIIHGENDPASTLSDNKRMAELIPRAKRISLAACGHYSVLEKPETVTALLQYWLQE